MSIGQSLLPEFDREMEGTRKTLERVPDGEFGWKPHEKSMTIGRLAQHVSELPGWATFTIETESLDIAPVGEPPYQSPKFSSVAELVNSFDENVKKARAAIAAVSDEDLQKTWTLLAGGKTLFTMPRMMVLRVSVLNHLIHHRAQLGVYLRLKNVPLPALYGPSADENRF
jgi:uncharacterized damage-inducible protein DinB